MGHVTEVQALEYEWQRRGLLLGLDHKILPAHSFVLFLRLAAYDGDPREASEDAC